MNRKTRDEILHTSLDMADIATLNMHERPHGVIVPIAYSIAWLQTILDMFHNRYPFATDVEMESMTVRPNNHDLVVTSSLSAATPLTLPQDFAIDVTDGLIAQHGQNNFYRVKKLAFQPWLRVQTFYRSQVASQPRILYYTIIKKTIKIVPTIETAQQVDLWHYKVPPVLEANDIPEYPTDWTLIEYVRLRALEWVRHPSFPTGGAQAYAEKELSADRQAGLLQKSEEDQLQLSSFGDIGNYSNDLYGFISGWPQVAS